jgi:hypothetical protein
MRLIMEAGNAEMQFHFGATIRRRRAALYASSIRLPIRSLLYVSSKRHRARLPQAMRLAGSSKRLVTASAIARGFFGGISTPASSVSISAMPPALLATIPRAAAIASRQTLGKFSQMLGNTQMSASANWLGILARGSAPVNCTEFAAGPSSSLMSSVAERRARGNQQSLPMNRKVTLGQRSNTKGIARARSRTPLRVSRRPRKATRSVCVCSGILRYSGVGGIWVGDMQQPRWRDAPSLVGIVQQIQAGRCHHVGCRGML